MRRGSRTDRPRARTPSAARSQRAVGARPGWPNGKQRRSLIGRSLTPLYRLSETIAIASHSFSECRADSSPRCAAQGHFAQQARSNSALRSHANHHAPALPLLCNALLREGSCWASWWGSLDGMQGVRGSNPLSSTRHNASAVHPHRAACQRIARVTGEPTAPWLEALPSPTCSAWPGRTA
jgi:hypothetical protein